MTAVALPESWQPAKGPSHREIVARLADYRSIRSIVLARETRDIHGSHALMVRRLSPNRLTVDSVSKSDCNAHLVTTDGLWPVACDCIGFSSHRYCRHIGSALLHILRTTVGPHAATRAFVEASRLVQEQIEQRKLDELNRQKAEARRQRDNNVVHSFTPKRGDWLRPE